MHTKNSDAICAKLTDTADWLGRGLAEQARELSLILKPQLDPLSKKFDRSLQREGFDRHCRSTLARVSPLAAARVVLARKPLQSFFKDVETAGRELARRHVALRDVTRALQLCDSILDGSIPSDYTWAREQLSFCTVLALNSAYSEVYEAESRIFSELFHLEVNSSNLDVLYRRFIELLTENCGAAAGHLFLLNEDGRHWRLAASTAKAASAKTLAILPVKSAVRKGVSQARKITRPSMLFDAGWENKYSSLWSIPFPENGVMQFAFTRNRELLPRELEMLITAGERCQFAARKTRLLEDIALREDQLRKLAIRMLMVEENERRRISRELHDDAGQSLVVIRLQMEMIEQALPEGTEERDRLAEARDITEKTILDLRRLIGDLSPAVLEQLGLGAALRQLAHRFRERYQSVVRLYTSHLPPMDTNFQLVIYRLVQECFSNIAQHSHAKTVNISLAAVDRVLKLNVEDDGVGFDVESALDSKECFGLVGIRERVGVLGGTISITSTRKDGEKRGTRKKTGTVIEIELPIP